MRKVAVITGASRGIGRACAIYFAEQGYDLAMISRSKESLKTVEQHIEEKVNLNRKKSYLEPVKYKSFDLDVGDKQAVDRCIQHILQHHDSIDVLVNAAGIAEFGTSAITEEQLQQMLSANVLGIYNFVHAVVPNMKKQNSGFIINMASRAGKVAHPALGAYALTKHAVVGYSQALFKELSEYNIKVTAICPSVVNTEMAKVFQGIPDNEKIDLSDIVKTVDYLLRLGKTATVDEIVIQCPYIVTSKLF